MATFIKRGKSGRIISRKKFTPGTKDSPFFKKSSKKKSSKKSSKQTAAERTNFEVKIVDSRTGKTSQEFTKQIESKSLIAAKKRRGGSSSSRKITAKELEIAGGLRPKIEEIKTGKVISEGRFKINRNVQRQIDDLRKIERITANKAVQLKNQIKAIELRKDLDIFQKETEKRKLFGIITDVRTGGSPPPATLNTLDITPKKSQLSSYRKLENRLYNEYIRISRKSVDRRTNKEMALIALYGGGSAALGTIRKIPQATWDVMVAFVRPDLIVTGIISIATNSEVRGEVNKQISKFGNKLQKGDPDAVSTLVAELVGLKAANKIIAETGKVVSVTKPARIVQEAIFTLSQPKEIRPFVKQILKGARVQEKLKPADLKGIKKINFNEVSELNKIEAIALKKTLQETDSFVFGSLPARTLSAGKTKLPKDVDLATKNIKVFQEEFINNLPKNIRKDYKIGKESVNKGKLKLLDIKEYGRLRPNQTIFGTGRLPINTLIYRPSGKAIIKEKFLKLPTKSLLEIEGIKLVGFGEQTTRKALGTLQVILEKGARRAKDPAAFIESLEIQLAALEGKLSKAKFVKKYLLKTKANDLRNAIKVLKSKEFQNLLNKKVPGLSKEFPILKKINKLTSKAKKKISDSVKKKINKLKPKKGKELVKGKPKKGKGKKKTSKSSIIKKKLKSQIPKSRIPKSRIPKSRIPKSRVPKSRVPQSRIPTGKSRIPQGPTSRIPTGVSRIPKGLSRIPQGPPSRIPTGASRIPSGKSKIPSGAGKVSTKPPKKPKKKLKLSFTTKLPKGSQLAFDFKFRERSNPSKLFNKKTNPVETKLIRKKDPKNTTLVAAINKIRRSTARSIDLKIGGVTTKNDVSEPSLKGFRLKKVGTDTLRLVQINPIETLEEKALFAKARKKARLSKPKAFVKKKVNKVSKSKVVNKKSSKKANKKNKKK